MRRTGRATSANAGLALALTLLAQPCHATEPGRHDCPPGKRCAQLSPAQLFELAEHLANSGDVPAAKAMLGALQSNPDQDVRAEARFRLGNLLQNSGDLEGAARSYRALLDEKPKSTRVRLELANVLARMGNEDAARNQLRRASSSGLPEDVAQAVNRFELALRSRRRSGVNIEVGLAPDTNINRATRNAQVNFGAVPIDLSPDAQAQSGIGATFAAGAFWRPALDAANNLLLTASASGLFYKQSQFDDISLSLGAGPELLRGASRFRPSIVISRQWFGGRPYGQSYGAALNILHKLGPVSQFQVDATTLRTHYMLNNAQSGRFNTASLRYERAISPRLAVRLMTRADRQVARDRAFSTWTAGGELLVSRDVGRQSLYIRAGYYRIWGDAPYSFPPQRRSDRLIDGEVGLLLRGLTVRGLAPVIRVHLTESRSPVFFYDFKRTRVEFALTRDF